MKIKIKLEGDILQKLDEIARLENKTRVFPFSTPLDIFRAGLDARLAELQNAPRKSDL